MFADLLGTPGVQECVELRSPAGFMALHGGSLERRTAEIASLAATRAGASLYAVLQPENLRWHLPSHLADPTESDGLRAFLAHCDVVFSLHGYGRDGYWTTVLVGGADRPFAATVATALRAALPGYEVVDDLATIPVELRGVHPANPVNLAPRGVQLELPPRVRGLGPRWHHLVDGELAPPTRALVDTLAALARDA